MNYSVFEDCHLFGTDDLHDTLSIVKKIKYHGKILNVDNYYCNGNKFVVESDDKEYIIYNELGLYVVEELDKDYIQVFDVVEQ